MTTSQITHDTGRDRWAHGSRIDAKIWLGPCPRCGDRTYTYTGRDWRCDAMECGRGSEPTTSELPAWWIDGTVSRVYLDGMTWVARDGRSSLTGTGPTPARAVDDLARVVAEDRRGASSTHAQQLAEVVSAAARAALTQVAHGPGGPIDIAAIAAAIGNNAAQAIACDPIALLVSAARGAGVDSYVSVQFVSGRVFVSISSGSDDMVHRIADDLGVGVPTCHLHEGREWIEVEHRTGDTTLTINGPHRPLGVAEAK